MTNSDSGTKLNPGDRVRVRHDPKRDDSLQARHADRRAVFNGKVVRVETIERDGDVLVSEGTDDGAWFNPDEAFPIVTDADGHEVGAPASPLDVLDAAVQQALAAARREAQGWHSAALLARGEAEEARDALRVVQGEADALRGKLGAANAEVEEAVAVLHREREVRQAAEERLAAVAHAWGTLRAWMLALPRPLGAAGIEGVDAVDKALGGVAVAKVAGPWRWLTSPKCWARAAGDGRNVAIVFGAEAPPEMVGWQARGADGEWVHGAEPSQGAADRALLAAGWTLENPTGGTGDALPCELTVNFSEWYGTAHAVPTSDREPRRWRLMFPMASPVAAAEQRNLVAPGRIKHDALIGGWVGRVMVVQRAPVVGAAIELEVVEWIEPKEAKPEREDCPRCVYWRTEIETRVARLESGEALAKMLEAAATRHP